MLPNLNSNIYNGHTRAKLRRINVRDMEFSIYQLFVMNYGYYTEGKKINPARLLNASWTFDKEHKTAKNHKNNNNHNSSYYYDKKGLHPSRRET